MLYNSSQQDISNNDAVKYSFTKYFHMMVILRGGSIFIMAIVIGNAFDNSSLNLDLDYFRLNILGATM